MIRPFHFGVVCWGEEFRNYFLDYCLPSLLAPVNIPALENKDDHNQFLICTTRADWEAMQSHPIFTLLKREIESVLIEMLLPGNSESKMRVMSSGHKAIAEEMHRRRVYGTFVYPDTVFADGVVAEAQDLAQAGKKVVLANCPRFANEGFLSALTASGLQRTGRPIILKPEELIRLAMPHMHSETRRYEWDAPYFYARSPVVIWWKAPGTGMLMYSTCWAPILVDYSALTTHDTFTLEDWTIDGDYIHRNFPDHRDVHASNTMTLISFTPESRLSYLPLMRLRTDYVPVLSQWFKEMNVRSFVFSPAMDPLKRDLYRRVLQVGGGDASDQSKRLERRAAAIMSRCFSPIAPGTQSLLDLMWILNDGLMKNFRLWIRQRWRRITGTLTSSRIPRSGAPV